MVEQWKVVEDYPDYLISDHGRVWSNHRKGRFLRLGINPRGYKTVRFYGGGRRIIKTVHSAVLKAFVGPRPGDQYDCCHQDGCKTNNHLWNLRWDTKVANVRDMVAHGTYQKCYGLKLNPLQVSHIRSAYRNGWTYRQLVRLHKIASETVRLCVNRETYKWLP